MEEYEVSITRACRLMEIHRSYYYYTSSKDDADVEDAIREAGRFGEGFWKIFKICAITLVCLIAVVILTAGVLVWIVFTPERRIYYTDDHYKTFTEVK